MNIVELLETFYVQMTKTEKKITKRILSDLAPLSVKSAKDASEYYKTSPATLIRIAKRIGLSGYSEFSFQAKQYINSQQKQTQSIRKDFRLKEDLTAFTNAIDQIKIAKNDQALHDLTKSIRNANRIIAVGTGHTGLAADYLKYLFLEDGITIDIYTESMVNYLNVPNLIKPGDLVIIFSASGSMSSYEFLYKRIIQKDVTGALLTMNSNNPYLDKIDITCVLPNVFSLEDNSKIVTIDSRPMFFILISCLKEIFDKEKTSSK